jgi:hypothetical protein
VWAALRAQGLAALVGDLYAPLPAGAVAAMLQARRLGAARLRLLPKATGGKTKCPMDCRDCSAAPLPSLCLARCRPEDCWTVLLHVLRARSCLTTATAELPMGTPDQDMFSVGSIGAAVHQRHTSDNLGMLVQSCWYHASKRTSHPELRRPAAGLRPIANLGGSTVV